MVDLIPLQFGLPGGPELLIILLIAVLLFGANKIPKLARSTGEAMGEFQKGREEVEQELQEMRDGATGDSTEDAGTSTTDDETEEFEVADAESETESEPEEETN
ncbi:twin-arginine translocase TatA/TatE family subunit [Natronomonas halophila]|uniref:twin-arginine translocase TatA/TatE family subunit n=1 Tax=Natronomonas halophila TaxID=2747817 RepID=UPI0015B6B09E|nr:twin-arginine translocase TatA/TatE family subunit [Natronomonas halophila]QLD86982.1 twin-arginine translocase TatA/TatE family subunit [Natronomonas halophila]